MRLRSLLLACTVAVLPSSAGADSSGARAAAKDLFRAGNDAYYAGRYLVAARAYEQAGEKLPLAAITFSAAQAYRRQYYIDGDRTWLERSEQLYRRYLIEQPDGGRRHDAVTHLAAIEALLARTAPATETARPAQLPTQILVSSRTPGARARVDGGSPKPLPLVWDVEPGSHTVLVEAPGFRSESVPALAVARRLAVVAVELRALAGRVVVDTEPGAEVLVDGRIVGVAPLGTIDVDAGTHRISVRKRGRVPESRQIAVGRGGRATVHVPLEATQQRQAAWVSMVAGGGLGVCSIAVTALALEAEGRAKSHQRRLDSGRPLSASERDDYNAALSLRDDLRTASLVLAGAAVTLGTAGALLFVLEPPGELKPGTTGELAWRARF